MPTALYWVLIAILLLGAASFVAQIIQLSRTRAKVISQVRQDYGINLNTQQAQTLYNPQASGCYTMRDGRTLTYDRKTDHVFITPAPTAAATSKFRRKVLLGSTVTLASIIVRKAL